jgi:hypothetical protein
MHSPVYWAILTDTAENNAVNLLLRAFEEHDVVAIGQPHGLRDVADFAHGLMRDPGFAETVDDVVVEWGNRRYQELADRFTGGEDIAPALLLPIWQNTTQPGIWDPPMYPQVLVRVREINRGLPAERHLRVLLGDAPIDWSRVRTGADLAPYTAVREAHFAGVIEAEVLRKGRKALFWAGGSHVVHKPQNIPNPINLLARRGFSAYVVLAHRGFISDELEGRLSAFPVPSLLRLENTWLGRLDASAYFHEVKAKGGNPYMGTRLEEAADACLYLGPRDSLTFETPPEDLYTGEYGEEIKRRRAIMTELWRKV